MFSIFPLIFLHFISNGKQKQNPFLFYKKLHLSLGSMKFPPKKPHFFKPILPGFKDGLNIPIGFLKYLRGYEHIKRALLKKDGKKWLVKVNGRRFKRGWKKFVKDHDLQLGDLLIFRHDGDMKFDVSIFDSTHCGREDAEYLQIEQEQKQEDDDDDDDDEEEAHTAEENSTDFEFEEKPSPSIESSDKSSSHSEAAAHKPFGHSSFICNIKPYCLTYGYLRIPKYVPFANGLITNKKYDLLIRDEKKRSWNLKLNSCETQTFIGDGWREFSADKCLKVGDRIMFEIVTDSDTPIWKFRVVTDAKTPMKKFQENATEKPKPNVMSSHKDFLDVEAANDMPRDRPHFIYTIKHSTISKYMLHVPKPFALENGLSDRKSTVLIRDEQRRSWEFRLYTSAGNTFIGGRWYTFCAANFLKEGDCVMLEILSKGEEPILKLYDLRANASLQPEEKPNLDANRVSAQGLAIETSDMHAPKAHAPAPASANSNSHFVSTIKPYNINRSYLHVPIAFIKSNGLMDQHEMILRDEQQRSWLVQLSKRSLHIAMTRGLHQFMKANGVQVGDTYKFELIDNKTMRVVHFPWKDVKHERSL